MSAEPPRLVPVSTLNKLELDDFVLALRPLFEAADPLARALASHRPYLSYMQLLGRAEWLVQTLPVAQQIEVVNAHPRIGETVSPVSSLSYREQGNDRELTAPADELDQVYARLAKLNAAYEDRFGFRFVVFVNGRPKTAIADALEVRLSNTFSDELQTGLRELFLIARDRLRLLSTQR